jgi:hypothetical protein
MVIRKLSFVLLALLGSYSLGNASLTPNVDVDAIYGGANCKQRAAGDGIWCNEYSPGCIACDSTGQNTKCITYKNSYNCLACTGPTPKDCGGSAYQGTRQPNGLCGNAQPIGQCSRTYNEATSGGCANGQSACP